MVCNERLMYIQECKLCRVQVKMIGFVKKKKNPKEISIGYRP